MAEEKKNGKVRRPSALKRDLQSEKRRILNKTYRSTVNTAIKALRQSLSQNDIPSAKARLNEVYSLMDKGVKKGIFKLNKASRVKARLTSKASARA